MRMFMTAVGMALLLSVPTAWSYDEMTVTDGGTITGKVTLTGGKAHSQSLQPHHISRSRVLWTNFYGDRLAVARGI